MTHDETTNQPFQTTPQMPAVRPIAVRRARLRLAAFLLLIQGLAMEGLITLALPVMLALGLIPGDLPPGVHVFALPYLNDNLALMMVMSGIFGALRTVGAIGVLKNRAWGLHLSLINCTVTLVLMIFMLPAGIVDGILSGGALVLLLMARSGRDSILPSTDDSEDRAAQRRTRSAGGR
ncbi:hypothetical protein [Plantibacter sp. CFBP 8804]|uniref:hypothetical protein n=1 Tax=Plantibacter sp. CFBP 8804 TaxID=2775270 RepID=UPI0017824D7C|nr:hypothetical protein [Plantibacter sp. CFBP 8804]